jgi:hypothetical protein
MELLCWVCLIGLAFIMALACANIITKYEERTWEDNTLM